MPVGRPEAVREIAAWCSQRAWPLFSGSGYTTREIAGNFDSSSHFYLLGGMGLAGAVAAGFARASPIPGVVAVEGDGNFLLGLSGAMGRNRVDKPFIHCVLENGQSESTGGQSLSAPLADNVDWICDAFGYILATRVGTANAISSHLDEAALAAGPSLLVVSIAVTTGSPPRSSLTPTQISKRFRRWAVSS